jgi:hypothetical protein
MSLLAANSSPKSKKQPKTAFLKMAISTVVVLSKQFTNPK